MPFDIGFGELVMIGVVALIVIGPQDFPKLFRNVGRMTGRMRGMADDFRRTMEAAADDAGVNELKTELKQTETDMRSMNFDDIDAGLRETQSEFEADLAEEKRLAAEAKARVENVRTESKAIKAEARAKMLREQAQEAEAQAQSARAKVNTKQSKAVNGDAANATGQSTPASHNKTATSKKPGANVKTTKKTAEKKTATKKTSTKSAPKAKKSTTEKAK